MIQTLAEQLVPQNRHATHESTPLGLPDVVVGLERCTRVRAISMGRDKSKLALLASLLDTSETLTVLFPARAIAASDLCLEASLLQGRIEDLDEVCGLLTVRLHGGVGCVEIRLVEEADVLHVDAVGAVVLDVPDDLVGVGLSPVASGTRGVGDATKVATVEIGA